MERHDITHDILAIMKRRARVERGELVQALHSNDRLVREAISDLRRQGYLIIGDENGGYRLARNYEDVFRFVGTITREARVLDEVASAMLMAAAKQFDKADRPLTT